MLGGLVSALIVGAILERGNLYANVVAESYAQGAEDEAFWQGLSEEETKKAKEMLEKIKAAKGQKDLTVPSPPVEVPQAVQSNETSQVIKADDTTTTATTTTTTTESGKKVDMFNDYAD